MSNAVFEFKKFIIKQDRCAMKVSTDAVLLGSWIAVNGSKKILDIGTGTGIIALMLAQKTSSPIIALEIDPSSCEQAKENIEESIYKGQINAINISFQDFWKQTKDKFDLIVTNPPYFVDSLKSTDVFRSTARHAHSLPFNELIEGVKNILALNGKFCLILPKKEAEQFRDMAEEKGFYLSKLLRIRTRPGKEEDKRHLMQFEFKPTEFSEKTIYIETETPAVYTEEYKQLTKDYYLNF